VQAPELRIPSQVISTIVLTVPTAKLIAFWDNLYRSWKVRMNNAAAFLVEELVDIAVFVSQSKLYIERSSSIESCGSGSAVTAPGPTPTGVEGSATGVGTKTGTTVTLSLVWFTLSCQFGCFRLACVLNEENVEPYLKVCRQPLIPHTETWFPLNANQIGVLSDLVEDCSSKCYTYRRTSFIWILVSWRTLYHYTHLLSFLNRD